MVERRTTLKDIAKVANVSVMSVSNALNDKDNVSPKTKKLILDTAHKLNYFPNMTAKSLRLDKTNTLGIIVSDSSEMACAKVLRGIADSAFAQGYNILTINTDGDSELEYRAIELFHNKCVDGILMIAPTLPQKKDRDWVHSFHIPMAILMRDGTHLSIDSVLNDNLLGGYNITNYFIQRGYRSFKFLSLASVSQVGIRRLEGAKRAFQKHGLTFNPNQIRHCSPHISHAQETMQMWLNEEGVDFDVLVCACDMIAAGAMKALLCHGVRIPEQVCMSGYDDIELSEHLRVPLTTIRQPLYEIGKKGVDILLERIKTPDIPTQHILLNHTLIERDSSIRQMELASPQG